MLTPEGVCGFGTNSLGRQSQQSPGFPGPGMGVKVLAS